MRFYPPRLRSLQILELRELTTYLTYVTAKGKIQKYLFKKCVELFKFICTHTRDTTIGALSQALCRVKIQDD